MASQEIIICPSSNKQWLPKEQILLYIKVQETAEVQKTEKLKDHPLAKKGLHKPPLGPNSTSPTIVPTHPFIVTPSSQEDNSPFVYQKGGPLQMTFHN